MSEVGSSTCVHADGENVTEQQTEMETDEKSVTELVLRNQLILDVIFDHLEKKDWKSARLVNKIWNSTLQARWRGEMIYDIGVHVRRAEGAIVVAFSTEFLEQQHPANEPNDPLQLGCYPIQNISVQFIDQRLGAEEKDKRIVCFEHSQTRFWELYGHGLKCIHLDQVRIQETSLFKRLLFELTPNLEEFSYSHCAFFDMDKLELNTVTEFTPPATLQKNLKVLKLNTPMSGYYWEWMKAVDNYEPGFPISWIEFFSLFPNIQKLTLEIDPWTIETGTQSDLLKLLQTIDIIRKANNYSVLNITELHTDEIGFAHVDVLQNQSLFASLPISSLSIWAKKTSYDKIITLIQIYKSTLRRLTLQGWALDEPVPLPSDLFPQGLTKLCLDGPFVSSLEFLMYTPNLEELEVKDIPCILSAEGDPAAIAPLLTLKRLKYIIEPGCLTGPYVDIQLLVTLMPNLTTLICFVDGEGFRIICREWPNLQHLDIDRGSGFGTEDFFLENLIQLKHLRSLNLGHCGFLLTDKSVFEGFLKMPSLTKIEIGGFNTHITEEGFHALKGKLCEKFVRSQRLRRLRRAIRYDF